VVVVDGVSGVKCSSSARTVQEASDSEADWEQSTAYQYWDVVPPPGLSKKQAIAKLTRNSRRRGCF